MLIQVYAFQFVYTLIYKNMLVYAILCAYMRVYTRIYAYIQIFKQFQKVSGAGSAAPPAPAMTSPARASTWSWPPQRASD